jgi:hypothetical protein
MNLAAAFTSTATATRVVAKRDVPLLRQRHHELLLRAERVRGVARRPMRPPQHIVLILGLFERRCFAEPIHRHAGTHLLHRLSGVRRGEGGSKNSIRSGARSSGLH